MDSSGGLVIRGDDGNFRVFDPDGNYLRRFSEYGVYASSDCTGDRYVNGDWLGENPFRMITRVPTYDSNRNVIGELDLIESLDPADRRSASEWFRWHGESGGCYPFSESDQIAYIKMVTPSFSVGTPVPPLKIVEAP